MIDKAVYNRLKNLSGGRVHFVQLPQKPQLPALVYTVISSVEEYSDDGHEALAQYRIQIDAWGRTRDQVMAAITAAKAAMRTSGADFETTGEEAGTDEKEKDTQFFHASVDFIVWAKLNP